MKEFSLLLVLLECNGNADEDQFYAPPAFAFDHRVPDGHSFPDELRPLIVGMPPKPYADESTAYYSQNQQDFDEYYVPIREARERQRAAAPAVARPPKRTYPPQ